MSEINKGILDGYFTAIDFETADKFDPLTICQVGICIVEKFEIVRSFSILVRPPYNYYNEVNIQIHGITPDMTNDADTWGIVYPKIEGLIEGRNIVAHNMQFDWGYLSRSCTSINIEEPKPLDKYCTYKIYGHSLATSCRANDIELTNHHQAEADAIACAKLMILYLTKN